MLITSGSRVPLIKNHRRTFHYGLSLLRGNPSIYNQRPTELMKAKLKAQSPLINLRRQGMDTGPRPGRA